MIKLDLTPHEIDVIFVALQHATLPNMAYSEISALMQKMLEQGRPQYAQLQAAEQTDEDDQKPGGTD